MDCPSPSAAASSVESETVWESGAHHVVTAVGGTWRRPDSRTPAGTPAAGVAGGVDPGGGVPASPAGVGVLARTLSWDGRGISEVLALTRKTVGGEFTGGSPGSAEEQQPSSHPDGEQAGDC